MEKQIIKSIKKFCDEMIKTTSKKNSDYAQGYKAGIVAIKSLVEFGEEVSNANMESLKAM